MGTMQIEKALNSLEGWRANTGMDEPVRPNGAWAELAALKARIADLEKERAAFVRAARELVAGGVVSWSSSWTGPEIEAGQLLERLAKEPK